MVRKLFVWCLFLTLGLVFLFPGRGVCVPSDDPCAAVPEVRNAGFPRHSASFSDDSIYFSTRTPFLSEGSGARFLTFFPGSSANELTSDEQKAQILLAARLPERLSSHRMPTSNAGSCGRFNAEVSFLEEESRRREQLFRQLSARAEAFRRSALHLGLEGPEAARVISDGWAVLTGNRNLEPTESSSRAISERISETDFLLRALDSLEPCAEVGRARAFAISGCGQELTAFWPTYSQTEQFQRAALGKSNDFRTWSANDASMKVLKRWKSVSAELIACQWERESQAPQRDSNHELPQLAFCGTGSVTVSFRTLVALCAWNPNPLETLCVRESKRFPRMSSFSLAGSLSAGRKPVLLI